MKTKRKPENKRRRRFPVQLGSVTLGDHLIDAETIHAHLTELANKRQVKIGVMVALLTEMAYQAEKGLA